MSPRLLPVPHSHTHKVGICLVSLRLLTGRAPCWSRVDRNAAACLLGGRLVVSEVFHGGHRSEGPWAEEVQPMQ